MSDCNNGMCSQFKAIQARLDRVDDDLIAHYAGISQLVAGLAAHPLTAPGVALSLPTFNFSSAGHTLVKKLMGLVPGYDQFKALQNLEATSLVSGLAGKMESFASSMLHQVEQEIASAVNSRIDAVTAQVNAIGDQASAIANHASQILKVKDAKDAVNAAIAAGKTPEEIKALQDFQANVEASLTQAASQLNIANQVKDAADAAVNQATALVDEANKVKAATGGFVKSLTDIAGCKTPTSIVGK